MHSQFAKQLQVTGSRLVVPLALLLVMASSCGGNVKVSPWERLPSKMAHTDHAALINGPFDEPGDVTRNCLECHPDAAGEIHLGAHWTWISDEVEGPDGELLEIGKRNMINNFCIAVPSNWQRCTSCHAGYGWKDDTFDFTSEAAVDCLVCHEQTGGYVKDPAGAGMPADGVDLLASAKSVGRPTRANCGACHFAGGGGDAVKHGDMDATMLNPSPRIDVHMGEFGFDCIDCHRTEDHNITGRLVSTGNSMQNRISCTDCHEGAFHDDARLDMHLSAVSCQACHIPEFAVEAETKLSWNWSTAGLNTAPQEHMFDPEADHHYNKKKGSFVYGSNQTPVYRWYDGAVSLYLPNAKIEPGEVTQLNSPTAGIELANAKLTPFKEHRGSQPYDANLNHLLVPKLFGEDGYWTTYDWDSSLQLGAEASGVEFSGEFGWVETMMYWPITHMVQPKENSLQCTDCHGEKQLRLDWQALGYDSDPMYSGTRKQAGLLDEAGGVK